MPLLTQMGQDDQNTTLLKALRPYLHGEREKRLDDSVRMMQLLICRKKRHRSLRRIRLKLSL